MIGMGTSLPHSCGYQPAGLTVRSYSQWCSFTYRKAWRQVAVRTIQIYLSTWHHCSVSPE